MLLIVENQELSTDNIKKKAFDPNKFSPNANYVIEFIVSWLNGTQDFQFHTSGSTGKPKSIHLSREVLEYSARQTMEIIGWPPTPDHRFLLCINPHFIGGTMVIVRALLSEAILEVVPPSSDVVVNHPYHLASMVPMQVTKILEQSPETFNHLRQVLIGGGQLHANVEAQLLPLSTQFYHTYGMTETASHVALRKIGQPYYKAVGDAHFQSAIDGSLEITGTVTDGRVVQTTDIVKLVDNQQFQWLGRKDFVINTGGFKVQPEHVESTIAPQLHGRYILSSLPDDLLGQRVVLIAEESFKELDFSKLHPYEKPKNLFFGQKVILTANDKVDRKATRDTLLKTLSLES